MTSSPTNASDKKQDKPLSPQELARLEQVEKFPFIAVTIQSTGIHPSTGRLVTVDALTYNAAGETGQEFHAVLNPPIDPGPRHQHGLSEEELAAGQQFSRILNPLDRLIDGRTLVVHDATYVWGFLVSEARRAMMAAARANRSRNRGRGRRRRQKVGHIPAPVAIVDTLATARRRNISLADVRLAAVAAATGLDTPDYRASSQRAALPEAQTSREQTQLLVDLERHQSNTPGVVCTLDPKNLRGDRFGLQRSNVRVDAAKAPRTYSNPGKFKDTLRKGMEFVIAPEISMEPDELIAAGMAAGLNYVEKLTRESSLIVCNLTDRENLQGKAMHADRKDIPLVSDERFLELLDNVAPPLPEAPKPVPAPGAWPYPRRPRRAGDPGGDPNARKRRRGSRGGNRRRRGKGNTN
ncbi:hypothetical protein CPHO_00995 [Corynebacterium phocae]|uniref:DNA polymerase III subunit epsilon n=1 Tax=Corynebacterium phocae TaxID=161895 RepID=A0A1L7D127_9CORY|nr:hypothetical protein [Corynebacterium phocae]APT91732.1 hypothetical protein CPHO_00995 [Corynebacterium phocae]KAA8728498.1 DNA polymerase III subunit epsilon [Corynebacterium phocae]